MMMDVNQAPKAMRDAEMEAETVARLAHEDELGAGGLFLLQFANFACANASASSAVAKSLLRSVVSVPNHTFQPSPSRLISIGIIVIIGSLPQSDRFP